MAFPPITFSPSPEGRKREKTGSSSHKLGFVAVDGVGLGVGHGGVLLEW